MGEKFYELVKYFGKESDIVIFRHNDEIFISNTNIGLSDDGTCPLPLHSYMEELENTVSFFRESGKSVRVVEYVNSQGKFTFPDLDELLESEDMDY